ncbi:MAG: DUF4091 domain-containing protein [Lentisphaeria bacterium]|nr:DUF4091 domain-containing protein [Lentisphaeria bacterium]MDY0177129.1 DUF4091 domain-containing protein [Lentisphaeria bacterium]
MKNHLVYLILFALSGLFAQDNLLLHPGLKHSCAGNAALTVLEDGSLQIKVGAGEGWPQLNIVNLPAPGENNSLRIAFHFDNAPAEAVNLSLSSNPREHLAGRYFNNEVDFEDENEISFVINDEALNNFRLSVKNPKVDFTLIISGIYFDRTVTLAEGYGFESPAEMGKWSSGGETGVRLSSEYAYRGQRSLKMNLPGKQSIIHFYPDITDWRSYKQLRFTLYNPLPAPNKKYRVLLVNRKYLPANCSISSGLLTVQPETVREFILELDSLPESVDLSNISSLSFFKGDPETVFYLDEMKLYTAEEVEELTLGKLRNDVEETLRLLKQALDKSEAGMQAKINEHIAGLVNFQREGKLYENAALDHALLKAKELAALVNSATGQKLPLQLLGAPSSKKIFRDEVFNEGSSSMQLSAAGHEWESFQVLALPMQDLRNLKVSATALTATDGRQIAAGNIKINPVGYIELRDSHVYNSSRSGFWPDILVHNQSLDLAERMQPYWITIYVPEGQKAGNYKGRILFEADGGIKAEYSYELLVHDFSLPLKGRLITYFDWRVTPRDPVIRRKCYDAMLDHRLSPTGMYTNGKSPDKIEQYEYSPHPDDLEHCLARGMNYLNIWYLYDGKSENPFQYSEEYLQKVKRFIDYYKPILQAKGAWEIATINGFDEIMHQSKETVQQRLQEARKICSWLKKDYPQLRLSNVGAKMDISTDLMDFWFLGALPKERTLDVSSQGGTVCFYWVYGNPSPMLDLPGMACRILSWQAFKEGAGGIAYYSTYRPWALDCTAENAPSGVDWPKERINASSGSSRQSPSHRLGRNGDGNLFYPDKDGSVLASTRIANVRDGVEDYEYLALLRELQPEHELLQIPDNIVTLVNDQYTKDHAVIEAYRRKVADAIVKALREKN